MSGHAGLLILALILDAIFGEPRWLWDRVPHPAVLMGRLIGALDRGLNRGAGRQATGAVMIALLCLGAGALGAGIAALPLGPLWEVLLAAIFLAQRSLVEHVQAVALGLREGLTPGRAAVAMIVGRDVSVLDESGVARAAIESAAENLSDGVVAPAFWFLIAGLPGIIIYKLVNTADSMIGHRTERHEAFGWAAARLDDVLNWVPARLTAAMIALTGASWPAWQAARREGPEHRSVNAGWPEAAMAVVLDLRLSGPRRYGDTVTTDPELNPGGRKVAWATDIEAAIRVLWRVWAVMVAAIAVLVLA